MPCVFDTDTDTDPAASRESKLADEANRRTSGDWGPWARLPFPPGGPEWRQGFRAVHENAVFRVVQRLTESGMDHFSVWSRSEIRPTFHEMQRIKDELAGQDRVGVEVYPRSTDLVDELNQFHLWVFREGLTFEFGLHLP